MERQERLAAATDVTPEAPRNESPVSFLPWILPPFLAGLGLRWVGLRGQILTGDELHSVHGALSMSVGEILRTWTFEGADYCVPITAGFRLLMNQGVVFSEISFRAPALAAGLAAVVVLPWLARARIGPHAAIALAWLIALSPMLVLYSRIVRPYMPALFAAGVAVLLFDRWLRAGRPSAAIGYALSGAFAVYLHLGAAPLVLAPLLYAAVQAALRPRVERAKEGMSLLWPALGIALAIGVFLLPAQESLLEVLRVKRDGQLPAAATWVGVLRLQLGTRQWIVAALALALIARGGALLWETQRDFLVYLATLVVAQVVGLMLLAPDRLEERAIMNRYMLVALPLLLIPLACGMTAPWKRGDGHGVVSGRAGHAQRLSALAISSVTLIALFATGPLAPGSAYWSSSFTHALTFVDFLADGNRMPESATPSFYRSLAAPGEDATLIEYPWQNLSSHTFDAYQQTHGLKVVVSSVIDRSSETRIALRNRVEPTAEQFLANRARYLVVHKNLRTEASRLVSGDIHLRYWLRAQKELWDPLRRAAEAMSNKLVRKWGPPSYEDVSIRVWDLDLVRRDAYTRGKGADVPRREGE